MAVNDGVLSTVVKRTIWHFYCLAYLPLEFLPSGIFTNDIFIYGNLTYAFLPMPFLPHTTRDVLTT